MPLPNTQGDPIPEKPLLEKVNDQQPLIAKPTYKSSVVDSRYTALGSLLKYVEGSPWPIEYFNQVKNSNEGTTSFQVGQHAIYQQYLHIVDMDIKVTQPLEPSSDSETHERQLNGVGNLPPGIKPNEGDVFFADMGDGREGFFTITKVERQTDLKDSVYEITYTFMGASDTALIEKNNLLTKVIKKLYFKKDFLSHGKKLLLVEEESNIFDVLNKSFNTIAYSYISKFWNKTFKCFIAPNENSLYIYDPSINKCMVSIVNDSDHPQIGLTNLYAIDEANKSKAITILDLLMRFDIGHFTLLEQKVWLVGASRFSRWPVYNGVYHSGLNYIAYPKPYIPQSDIPNDIGGIDLYDLLPPSLLSVFKKTELSGFIDDAIVDVDGQHDQSNTLNPPPLYFPVNSDDYYILSKAFYTNVFTAQSILELIIGNVIRRKTYNLNYLVDLIDDYNSWTPRDQFYIGPVLLLLIKNAIHYQ